MFSKLKVITVTTFLIVFVLVILFVIGTASAMRYFGNRSLPPKKDKSDNQP